MNYNTQFDLINIQIQRHINNRCAEADAYLTFKYGLKKFKIIKDKKTKEKTKIINNDSIIIDKFLKIRGYSKYGNIFTKGFVCVVVDYQDGDVRQISIKHDIPKINTKWFYINESFITGLSIALDYYERI